MSYYNESEIDYEERETIREEKSILRAEMERENPFLCMKAESGMEKCKIQCTMCYQQQTKSEQ